MTLIDTTVEEKLCQFIKEYNGDQCTLELLLFLSRHPHTRFSRQALVRVLDGWRADIEQSLCLLQDRGLVITRAENGIVFYSLCENDSRNPVLALIRARWQPRLRQLYGAAHA